MKILHTSDWHLGKKLENLSRLNEQQSVLNEIVDIVRQTEVELVLISGDIFDTFVPQSEAEELFYDTMYKLVSSGVAVVIISGNHDDPVRLSASKPLSEANGVFFCGFKDKYEPLKLGRINLKDGGKDYFVFENDKGESVYIAMVPYPTELRMKENAFEGEAYGEKIRRYISNAVSHNVNNLPLIVMTHIFMLGGERSEGERQIELGGARIVDKQALPDNAAYVALGHLHKRQVIDKNRSIIYSGSPLQYSFDESKYKKSVTIFEIAGGKAQNITEVGLKNYKQLYRLDADGYEKVFEVMQDHKEDIVELTVNLDCPPTSEMIKKIASEYPLCFAKYRFSAGKRAEKQRSLMNDSQLFTEFYKQTYGAEPKREMLDLFLKYMNKIEVEDET